MNGKHRRVPHPESPHIRFSGFFPAAVDNQKKKKKDLTDIFAEGQK